MANESSQNVEQFLKLFSSYDVISHNDYTVPMFKVDLY